MFSKNSILIAGALAGVMASGSASAEFIHSDVYVAGDSKAVLDTDTGLEWMKLSETKGTTINSHMNRDDGWRLATQVEVAQYIYNLFDMDESDFTGGVKEGQVTITEQNKNVSLATVAYMTKDVNSSWGQMFAQGAVFNEDDGSMKFYGIQYSIDLTSPYYNETNIYAGADGSNSSIYSSSKYTSPFLVSTGA